jgi:dihydrofolate reductase
MILHATTNPQAKSAVFVATIYNLAMVVSEIVTVVNNGVIGKEGDTPWYLPADLAHFRRTTVGHPIIMGRKTHESIGRALPGRQNIVITHDKNYHAEGCEVVTSLEAALQPVSGADEVFIIGGQSIYELALPRTDRIYLTRVDADIPGDKYFLYEPAEWQETSVEKHPADDKNQYPYEFVLLERKQ